MSETMRAAVLHGVDDLRLEEIPRPQLTKPTQALVKIGSVGICGSDIHFLKRGRIGEFIVREPIILGHEAAGEVVAVGEAVTHLKPGDRVAIEPGYPCGTCRFCRQGRYNVCLDCVFMATPPHDGAFCDYVAWPADFLYKLPDHLSLDDGAMLEPLSVGLFAVWRSGLQAGDTVAIFGAGPIGLTTLQCARAAGATQTIVFDPVPSRLEFARGMGASVALASGPDNEEQIRELTGGCGVDVSFECAGAVPALQAAIRATRTGGNVQLVGMPGESDPSIPIMDVIARELTVSGLFRYCNTYPAAVALAAEGKVAVDKLVTKVFSLDEAATALDWVHDNKDQVIKAVVRP